MLQDSLLWPPSGRQPLAHTPHLPSPLACRRPLRSGFRRGACESGCDERGEAHSSSRSRSQCFRMSLYEWACRAVFMLGGASSRQQLHHFAFSPAVCKGSSVFLLYVATEALGRPNTSCRPCSVTCEGFPEGALSIPESHAMTGGNDFFPSTLKGTWRGASFFPIQARKGYKWGPKIAHLHQQ